MNRTTLFLIFTVLFFSCDRKKAGNQSYDLAVREDAEMIPVARQSANSPSPSMAKFKDTAIDKSKIIKDGRLGLIVDNLEKTKSEIDTLVKFYNGYYASESLLNTDYESSYHLKIRIPFTNLDKFILKIESGNGQISYKEMNARDVTEEFIDLETRLENKRNYLKRFNELLNQAKTVKDILEIQDKTRVIEEEIESTEGRLKYLSDLVAFSSLDLKITKEKEFKFNTQSREKFTEQLKQSLSKGWYGFVDFLLFLIKLWPFWILLAMAVSFRNRLKNRRKNKK